MQNVQKEIYNRVYKKFVKMIWTWAKIRFFVFEMLIYFYLNVSSNFVIQEWVDPLFKKRFWKDIYSFL